MPDLNLILVWWFFGWFTSSLLGFIFCLAGLDLKYPTPSGLPSETKKCSYNCQCQKCVTMDYMVFGG